MAHIKNPHDDHEFVGFQLENEVLSAGILTKRDMKTRRLQVQPTGSFASQRRRPWKPNPTPTVSGAL